MVVMAVCAIDSPYEAMLGSRDMGIVEGILCEGALYEPVATIVVSWPRLLEQLFRVRHPRAFPALGFMACSGQSDRHYLEGNLNNRNCEIKGNGGWID